MALAVGRITGWGQGPPAFLAGKLPPDGEQGVDAGALAVLHQRPQQQGEFAGDQRAEGLLATAGSLGLAAVDFLRAHAAQEALERLDGREK